MIFNREMAGRLSALQGALEAGAAVAFERHAAFGHLPERVLVSFGDRRFALAVPVALGVADQIEANGFDGPAAHLREIAS